MPVKARFLEKRKDYNCDYNTTLSFQPAPITNGSANILGKNLLDSSSNSSDSSSNIHSKDTFCPLHTVIVDCSKISYVDIMGVQILINVSLEQKKAYRK